MYIYNRLYLGKSFKIIKILTKNLTFFLINSGMSNLKAFEMFYHFI